MIAVTIAVGDIYEWMAGLAIETVRRHTGLEVRILGTREMQQCGLRRPHDLKFRLFELFPDAADIMFFDADTIFLRPFNWQQYAGSAEIVCVRDRWDQGFIIDDARLAAIPAKEYFNTGLFIVNRDRHARWLSEAEAMARDFQTPFFEQTALNAARGRLGIPLRLLEKRFNFITFQDGPPPSDVVVGHMHGLGGRSKESIRRFYQYWQRRSPPRTPQLDEIATELVSRSFIYERVGHDSRTMRFSDGGAICQGAAGCEECWDLSLIEDEIVLWIAGGGQPTCGLVRGDDGSWCGHWIRYEQMPIRLTPI